MIDLQSEVIGILTKGTGVYSVVIYIEIVGDRYRDHGDRYRDHGDRYRECGDWYIKWGDW